MLALTALFQSRKFLIAFIVVVVMAPLVYLGKLSVDAFVKTVETLTVALIAAIGVEGAAEKWGAPPPPAPPGRVATAADSLKPPKLPTVPPMLMLCLVAIALPLAGCAWLTPSHVGDVASIAVCVIENDSLPPAQIALKCGAENEKQVVDILMAQRAATARKLTAVVEYCQPSDAGAPKDADGAK